MIDLDVAVEAEGWSGLGEADAWARRAVEAALAVSRQAPGGHIEISLLLTDDARERDLNRTWRGFDKPTNVLSFPSGTPPEGPGAGHLGDIVLAYETVVREAETEGKAVADHASHLIVHGTLHLLGLDHEEDADAHAMEALEIEALARLGITDPYRDEAA